MPDRAGAASGWRTFDRNKLGRLIVVSLGGLALAGVSAVQAATTVYDKRNPILANLLFGSSDARVSLWTANTLTDSKGIKDSRIVGDARAELRSDPLDTSAMRSLALYYDGAKKAKEARTLANLSEQASRRDPLTQLLLTQYAARDGNFPAALGHLDTALTTVGDGREQVYPIISAQLLDARLRKALPRLVGTRSAWVPEYLDHIIRNDPGGSAVAGEILLGAPLDRAKPVYARLGSGLLSGLAEAGEIDLLRKTYARVRGERPDISARVAFTPATIDPSLGWLAWSGVGDGSAGAEARPLAGGKGEVTVYASAGTVRTLALRRVLFLSPGTYRHFESRTALSGAESTSAQFRMSCLGRPGPAIWQGPVSGMDTRIANAPGPVVPATCPAQLLELFVASPSGSGGSEFVIQEFDLRRAG